MRTMIRKFPWLEVTLIVGLAVALIVKPRTTVLSATPQPTQIEQAVTSLIPSPVATSAPTQPR